MFGDFQARLLGPHYSQDQDQDQQEQNRQLQSETTWPEKRAQLHTLCSEKQKLLVKNVKVSIGLALLSREAVLLGVYSRIPSVTNI
jgi:hypothetical protein